jgi:outer membrane assembly lipoprotein YfiO
MGRLLPIAAFACFVFIGALRAPAAAPQTWEFRDGRWQSIAAPSTQPVSDPTLDHVEQLIQRGQNSTARKVALHWIDTHKGSALRDRALYLVAQALFQYGDRIRSFYYLDELMDEFPSSPLFYAALQKQYDIADAYLRGYKQRFLWIPMFTAEDEAVEMLYRIQQRSPGSPLAEKALRRTADWYYASSDFDLAADAYAAYVRAYPRSPDIARIRLRQAFSSLAQFRGVRFDATPLIDARAQLVDLAAAYPNLAEQENLISIVERIDNTFAAKIFTTADYFQRTGELRGAAYNYRFLIKTYPDSPEAAEARRRLDKMPASALAAPAPPAGHGYAPATEPVQVPEMLPAVKSRQSK